MKLEKIETRNKTSKTQQLHFFLNLTDKNEIKKIQTSSTRKFSRPDRLSMYGFENQNIFFR